MEEEFIHSQKRMLSKPIPSTVPKKKPMKKKTVSCLPIIECIITLIQTQIIRKCELPQLMRKISMKVYCMKKPYPQIWENCLPIVSPLLSTTTNLTEDTIDSTMNSILDKDFYTTCGTLEDIEIIETCVRTCINDCLNSTDQTDSSTSLNTTSEHRIFTASTTAPTATHRADVQLYQTSADFSAKDEKTTEIYQTNRPTRTYLSHSPLYPKYPTLFNAGRTGEDVVLDRRHILEHT